MTHRKIGLSLLSTLLIALNGCGDSSSNKKEEKPLTQNEQEVNNAGTRKAPIITLKGDSQVNIIQGSSYSELGATAVDSDGKILKVQKSGSVNTDTTGSYTIVYSAKNEEGVESSIIRTVQVTLDINVNVNVTNSTHEQSGNSEHTHAKNYYLTPIAKKSMAVGNIDLISGEVNFGERDISSTKGGVGLTRLYSSYDDKDKSVGTFKTSYESRMDAPLAESIKSEKYETIEASCTEGWKDIDGKAFLGKLEDTQAIFNHVTSLCDIYDDGELLASLMTKHVRSGKSNHLHTLTRPDGSTFVFFKKGYEWKTISKTPLKLKETESGFKLINLNDGIEEYNHDGKLLSVTNQGQTTTLNYSPRGKLISIIDPFGEKIELVYQRGMLKEAKSYDGTSVKYVYDADKQLSTVTYADGTSTTYSYNAKGDLETIKDSNGLITKTLTYDSTGKTLSTAGINGVNKTEFDYSNEKTIVSQTTGETDYHFRVLNSRLLTTKRVTDEGISSITYDSHGYPILSSNKFGVITKTTYDEEGLLVTKTTDADTAEQKITLTRI
jgi:YD repeat-containing protein